MMAIDRAKAVKKAFEHIGPTNPLRGLGEADKHILWSLLTIYAFERELEDEGNHVANDLEEAAKTATDAAALAKEFSPEYSLETLRSGSNRSSAVFRICHGTLLLLRANLVMS